MYSHQHISLPAYICVHGICFPFSLYEYSISNPNKNHILYFGTRSYLLSSTQGKIKAILLFNVLLAFSIPIGSFLDKEHTLITYIFLKHSFLTSHPLSATVPFLPFSLQQKVLGKLFYTCFSNFPSLNLH